MVFTHRQRQEIKSIKMRERDISLSSFLLEYDVGCIEESNLTIITTQFPTRCLTATPDCAGRSTQSAGHGSTIEHACYSLFDDMSLITRKKKGLGKKV